MDPENVLRRRCCIARLGERDGFYWWESDAVTEAGKFVFQRLLPRTYHWAGLEMAMEAARFRHAAFLPDVPAVTLFNLGGVVDPAVDEALFRHKLTGDVPPDVVDGPMPQEAGGNVTGTLMAMDVASEETMDRLRDSGIQPTDRTICLGDVAMGNLRSFEDVASFVEALTAAYCFSGPRRLVVPYFRLNDR